MLKKITKTVKGVVALLCALCVVFLGLMAFIWFGVLGPYYNAPNDKKATTELTFDEASGKVDQDVLDFMASSERAEKYQLGINDAGDVVFLKPRSAFNAAKKDLKTGWKYVDKDLEVKHLSKTYYVEYIRIADEDIDSDENASQEVKDQLHMLSEILKIYYNSYNRHR